MIREVISISANNYILIKEKKGRQNIYRVGMRDADTGIELGEEFEFTDLRDAIIKANKIQAEDVVEYGISIKLKK